MVEFSVDAKIPRWLKGNPAAEWAWTQDTQWQMDAIAAKKDAKWRAFLLREAERMYDKSTPIHLGTGSVSAA